MQQASDTLSLAEIPKEWKENYILEFFGDDECIYITSEERLAILREINMAKFISIRGETLAVSAIKRIKPRYGELNIPKKPLLSTTYTQHNGVVLIEKRKNSLIDLWENLYEKREEI